MVDLLCVLNMIAITISAWTKEVQIKHRCQKVTNWIDYNLKQRNATLGQS